MAGWLGPALIAAVIAALVSVAGWFVTAGQALRTERRRRNEKTRDFQIALRAEIRSELAALEAFDLQADRERVERCYASDPAYSVLVPTLPRHRIFEAIVPEIHVLAEEVIDPVVLYMWQRQVIDGVITDIRDPSFGQFPHDRQLDIYLEYLDLRAHLASLGRTAELALGQPL